MDAATVLFVWDLDTDKTTNKEAPYIWFKRTLLEVDNMAIPIDINKLKLAEAASAIAKDMITTAIEQSSANQIMTQEALSQAYAEIAKAQTMIGQVRAQIQFAQQK